MKKYKQIRISCSYNKKINDFFLKKYPNLTFGRKNYLNKEIEIAKNICLKKLNIKTKKIKNKKIKNFVFKKRKNKIILVANVLI